MLLRNEFDIRIAYATKLTLSIFRADVPNQILINRLIATILPKTGSGFGIETGFFTQLDHGFNKQEFYITKDILNGQIDRVNAQFSVDRIR